MTNRPTTVAPKARTERLIVRQIEGEWLYYDMANHRATYLNPFSARVLTLCDGRRTAAGIAESLQPDDVDEGIVLMTLEKLAKAKLLEPSYRSPSKAVVRTNRRDMMRGIGAGAGALAMVPVVSAITVPTPAQATSCLGALQPCTDNSQCCSGVCVGALTCL
jgi:hypothetical protein